jgi:hypothetical protein
LYAHDRFSRAEMSLSHKVPKRPDVHVHLNPLISSLQVAPTEHGFDEQSSTSIIELVKFFHTVQLGENGGWYFFNYLFNW